ncbi:cytochrome c oxidase subunit II [Halopseudomonas sabulinigri]|uniref:Cytochrome aa3 subunit 2 n=1 Tax=Halopseudomonas sabulinigri TaxID=472181 RepID=A0A1H1WU38_9GAMM|nr:cytochrome c oxidase subunit II [Halopseudomonas sabulinigri]SDT00562.1 cytochrome c oxidase subunit 2 [Halopseudomonas sabulinigri]
MSTLQPAGPSAQASAWLWWGMFAFFGFVLVALVLLWLHALRREPGQVSDREAQRLQNRWVVGGGLILPILSISVVLVVGIALGQRMLALPLAEGQPLRIEVVAHQWWWEVRYPESGVVLKDKLHIPAGQPVNLHLISEDVVHSFWVPRLAGKMDMFPGRTNVLRLEADAPGTYHGMCSEFCGVGHARMHFTVEAHTPAEFEAWLQQEQAND